MQAIGWMTAAERAAASARFLLDTNSAEGACDRAFIAMYSAACAAVVHEGYELGKTHQGVIGTFIERIVRNGLLPPEMARMLKTAENRRYQANESAASVTRLQGEEVVRDATTFVAAVHRLIGR